MSSSLDVLVYEIVAWQRATFPHATPASVAEHLRREAAELQAAPSDPSEIADLFFLVVGAAATSGVDLALAVRDKLRENRARVWGKPDASGVVEHVRADVNLRAMRDLERGQR